MLGAAGGERSIRGTASDAFVVCLFVERAHEAYLSRAVGFDAFYTYFASDGFTYGSSTANWAQLVAMAARHGIEFIPSVGPGYIDTQVRPWNGQTTQPRAAGRYYDRMWARALDALRAAPGAPGAERRVSVTSWNEWHEGTQIEPAVAYRSRGGLTPGMQYEDYEPNGPEFYLARTAHWVGQLEELGPAPAGGGAP